MRRASCAMVFFGLFQIGYVELYSNVSNEPHTAWIATFDFDFTYAVTRDIQLDAGVNIGLTDAADDVNPFLGLSLRY